MWPEYAELCFILVGATHICNKTFSSVCRSPSESQDACLNQLEPNLPEEFEVIYWTVIFQYLLWSTFMHIYAGFVLFWVMVTNISKNVRFLCHFALGFDSRNIYIHKEKTCPSDMFFLWWSYRELRIFAGRICRSAPSHPFRLDPSATRRFTGPSRYTPTPFRVRFPKYL